MNWSMRAIMIKVGKRKGCEICERTPMGAAPFQLLKKPHSDVPQTKPTRGESKDSASTQQSM